jgi:hypothetical protein
MPPFRHRKTSTIADSTASTDHNRHKQDYLAFSRWEKVEEELVASIAMNDIDDILENSHEQ